MTVVRLLWVGLLAAILPLGAHGQSTSIVQVDACAEQVEQRTAALLAGDWLRLELLAQQYLHTCLGVAGTQSLSDAYWSIATAKLQTGQYEKSVQASDDCIRVFYSNPGCHLIKSEALIALKRFNEARAALDLTERLAEHLLDNAEREAHVTEAADSEMHRARLSELSSILRRAAQIRKRLF